MNTLRSFIIALVLIVVAGAIYAFGTTLRDTQKSDNFSREGALVINHPELPGGVWHLRYQEGASSESLSALYFRESSECFNKDGGVMRCVDDFEEEAPVRVEGKTFGDGVLVSTLSVISAGPEMRRLNLYYYNPDNDVDEAGNLLCSREGLVPVGRDVEEGEGLEEAIGNTVALLLGGELSEAERQAGLTTEFPLEDFELLDADITGGTLTLTFSDPNHATSGGSCRAGILWSQIEATAKQFGGIGEVHFSPEELFQP